MVNELYRGDTWEIEIDITDKTSNIIPLLSEYEIRFMCQSTDGLFKVRKGNAKVTGGSIASINVLQDGRTVLVTVEKEDTNSAKPTQKIEWEVEITSLQGKRYTVTKGDFKVAKDLIDWESVT